MNLALLKKKSNTQKNSQDFSQQLSCQIFCIYKNSKKKYSRWFILISNFVSNKRIKFKQYLDLKKKKNHF